MRSPRGPAWLIEVAVDPAQQEAMRVEGARITARSLAALRCWGVILQTSPPSLWNTSTGEIFDLPPIDCSCGQAHLITLDRVLEGATAKEDA